MAGQHSRIDPPGHIPQFLEQKPAHTSDGSGQPIPEHRIGASALAKQAEFEGQSNQTLLRPVVKIALQPLPLLPSGLEHSDSRSLELLQPCP